MKTIATSKPKPAAIEADGTTPLTPEQIVELLRSVRQHVPDYGPLPVPSARLLHRTATVDEGFAKATINSIGASATMTSSVGRDAEALRNDRREIERWDAVEDEVAALLKGIASANLIRRHRHGMTLLQAYQIARQLVRKSEHSDLLPHVENMRRASKFGGRRRAKAEPPPAAETPQPKQ
jgi:hypothetical protein